MIVEAVLDAATCMYTVYMLTKMLEIVEKY